MPNNYKLTDNIIDVKKKWLDVVVMPFLNYDFLHAFFSFNTNIQHLFFFNKDCRLYAQIFTLKLFKTLNYSSFFSFIAYFFSLLKVRVLYFGNCYMTNYPFFISDRKIDVAQITKYFNQGWSILIIPDFIMSRLGVDKKSQFIKLEVDEDMVLDIDSNWKNLDSYLQQLRSKYRVKVNSIFMNSQGLKIKLLSSADVLSYCSELQSLFDKLTADSKFSGPSFNIQTLIPLINQNYAKVYGYFLQDRLIAFSSELYDQYNLYAYYVGFESKDNQRHAVYGRMLIEMIGNAIKLKKRKIIFGRSASEFKSNFGAYPIKSHIFIGFKNVFLYYLFKPFLQQLHIPSWTQRRPFVKKYSK